MDATYALAFQRLTFNHPQAALQLLLAARDAETIYAHKDDVRQLVPDATDTLCSLLSVDWTPHLEHAAQELAWCEKKNIKVLVAGMPDYPQRLLSCNDAPIVLYYLGNADLNARHIISVVGTRQCTPYGKDMIHNMIADLRRMIPDLVVVSGLAYGIDVCAHKEAMAAQLPTVGVVAHGLDTMYPASHRSVAVQMLNNGGLLTEYTSGTKGDRQNFLRRNRIVAGIADCTIVVESMIHGGSLVTARLSADYGREVFTFPGRVGDQASEGCNALIRDHKAQMILSAQNIVETLGWHTAEEMEQQREAGIQTSLFADLSADEQKIADALKEGDMQVNIISMATGLSISAVSALLFEMEMNGIVKPLAGGAYHLVV